MSQKEEILLRIKKEILSVVPDAKIYLFGSRARGDFHDESDWDILILTNRPVNKNLKERIRDSIYPIGWKYSSFIQTTIVGKEEWHNNPSYYSLRKNISENPILAL